jgi:hypothetical protein
MAADAVYDAIKTLFETAANVAVLADPTTGVVPPFRFENENFDKPDPPAPWIAMALTGVLYGQQSLGASTQADNRWDEAGISGCRCLSKSGPVVARAADRQVARGHLPRTDAAERKLEFQTPSSARAARCRRGKLVRTARRHRVATGRSLNGETIMATVAKPSIRSRSASSCRRGGQ